MRLVLGRPVWLWILVSVYSSFAFAQDAPSRSYFSRSFQTRITEVSPFERAYFYYRDSIRIEDFEEGKTIHKATLTGLQTAEEVDRLAFYLIQLGAPIHYKDFFSKANAHWYNVEDGQVRTELRFKKGTLRYSQVWNTNGVALLSEGSGEQSYINNDGETVFMIFKDSTIRKMFLFRPEKNDTIFLTADVGALPKSGLPDFYKGLVEAIRYPGIARLAGKEGRVYVQFVVDEKGKLTDFKPQSKEGYRFEARVIKKLQSLPDWNPALIAGRPVKTRFAIPVNFKLTD